MTTPDREALATYAEAVRRLAGARRDVDAAFDGSVEAARRQGGVAAFRVLIDAANAERDIALEIATALAVARPPLGRGKLTPRHSVIVREMLRTNQFTVEQVAAEFGVSRQAIYGHLSQQRRKRRSAA